MRDEKKKESAKSCFVTQEIFELDKRDGKHRKKTRPKSDPKRAIHDTGDAMVRPRWPRYQIYQSGRLRGGRRLLSKTRHILSLSHTGIRDALRRFQLENIEHDALRLRRAVSNYYLMISRAIWEKTHSHRMLEWTSIRTPQVEWSDDW